VNRYRQDTTFPAQGGGGFNPYAAGRKHYGSGRPMPTVGKVTDKGGYKKRDVKAAARRDALFRRLS
jgi:hypothetical protein